MGPNPVISRWIRFVIHPFLLFFLTWGTASAQLNASFTMDKSGDCSPAIIKFTNYTSGASGNAVYSWDLGNGNTSALPNPTAVYKDEKTYTVTLTVTDAGNTSTYSRQVTVYTPPTVDFLVSPAKICLGPPVTFTVNATPGSGSISTYSWDYGDGITENGYSASQQHTYTFEQVATVSVTVTNSYGCHTTLRKNNLVKVIPALTAGFTADKKVLCLVTDPVQFTNSSTGPGVLDYTWDFGDNTSSTLPSPSHTYSKKGDYPVSMKVHSSEGCTATATQSNPLNVANYNTDFSVPAPICVGSTVSFTDQSKPTPDNTAWEVDGSPVSYGWNSISYTWNTIGNHTVTLKNTFGTCPMNKTVTVSVKDIPHPSSFSSTIKGVCGAPVAVDFNDPTPGATKWEWDFAYQYYNGVHVTSTVKSPTYTYNSDGSYQVWLRMTNADGCSNNILQYVTITRPSVSVTAGAATISSCGNLMTNTFGTVSSEALTATQWSFGDGGTSTDPNPSHTFKNPGTYVITCNYTTVNGCKGSASITQYSLPFPTPPVISTNPGIPVQCAKDLTVNFSAYSADPLVSWQWDLGDNTKSTDPTPAHTYKLFNHYSTMLTYITKAGCKGTVSGPTVVIDPKITALDFSMTPNPVCGSNTVVFTPTANIYDINSWNWEFGDGNYGYNGPGTSYNYRAPGSYTVKLYARNIGGCDTTMSKTIVVNPPFPRIDGYTNTCDGTRGEVTFTQSTVQATTITWNFGDGTTATVPGNQTVTKHTYTKTGTYTVSISANNGTCTMGYTYPSPVYVLLKQSPQMTSSKSGICSNTPVDIQISKLDKNPFQSDVIYNGYYYAGYYMTGTQYGDLTDFKGNRTDAGYDYRWTTVYNATLNSFEVGKKNIRMIMKSYVFGCDDTTSWMPLAVKGVSGGYEIVADKLCYQSPVFLKDTSTTTPDNKILRWLWNFGDGVTQTNALGGIVTHTYSQPGNYAVSLQITDAAGCSSAIPFTKQVQVNGPLASFYPSGTDVHLATNVYFQNTTNDNGNTNTSYSWDFGDGYTSTDFSPSHVYATPGTYVVQMSAKNPTLPCASVAKSVTIIVRNFNSHFQFNSSYVVGNCAPMRVNFTNTSVGYTRVVWDFGDGVTVDNVNYPSHIYEHPGKYIVTLSVYGYNGLTGQYIDSVMIRDPQVSFSPPPTETCIGRSVPLTGTATYAGAYAWDFGDGSVAATSDGSAEHKYQTAGTYKLSMLVSNPDGCWKDTLLQQPLKVRPNPLATVSPKDPFLCAGTPVQLQAAPGSTTYQWTPATGLSNPNIANPIAMPDVTTSYQLKVVDDIGCENSAPIKVEVQQHLVLKVSPNDTVCKGEISKLVASGEDNYQWINDTEGLSDVNIANPIANPTETITYTVKGWDKNNCFTDQATVMVTVRPLPTVSAGPDLIVQAGYDAAIYAEGSADVVSWSWLPEKYLSCYNCASPLCTPLATTQYFVTVKNEYGCKARDTVVVAVDCQESRVRIPNAFTPNGDGSNDVFMIKGISIVRHMVIYDRWGEKVFERDNFIAGDRASCWDGTFRGQRCLAGTFVYFVEMECPAGGTFSRKGSFVLIR